MCVGVTPMCGLLHRVLARVSCEVVQPRPQRPTEGQLFFNVEFSPMASPGFEIGRSACSHLLVPRAFTSTHSHTRVRTQIHTKTHTHECTHTHTHTRTHLYVHFCTWYSHAHSGRLARQRRRAESWSGVSRSQEPSTRNHCVS